MTEIVSNSQLREGSKNEKKEQEGEKSFQFSAGRLTKN
jgi:hypothetical protein